VRGASKGDKEYLSKQIGAFLRQYGRRFQAGIEPNDRLYDRAIERYLRKLKPEELDVLLSGEEDERFPPTISE
jgi:hypothetical protein